MRLERSPLLSRKRVSVSYMLLMAVFLAVGIALRLLVPGMTGTVAILLALVAVGLTTYFAVVAKERKQG
jgi:hypothetical protein